MEQAMSTMQFTYSENLQAAADIHPGKLQG